MQWCNGKEDGRRCVDEQDCDPLVDVVVVAFVLSGAADTGAWSTVSLKGGEDLLAEYEELLLSLVPLGSCRGGKFSVL